MLDAHGGLHLVTDAVHEDDALCLALVCRPLRVALWALFPGQWSHLGESADVGEDVGDLACLDDLDRRIRTRDAALV